MQKELDYILERARRHSMRLSLGRSGEVKVMAPLLLSKKIIDEFVISKIEWIKKTKEKIDRASKVPHAGKGELLKEKLRAKKLILSRLKEVDVNKEFKYKRVTIKNITSRWGSCSIKGNLNFNYRLVYLPLDIVDYVVLHELCHLIEHNHGIGFWQEVAKRMTDYKVRQKNLKKHIL